MTKLTEFQTEFILEKFFKNEAFAGWRNIGTSLLFRGYSIVPGNKCIWQGGIGNFIKLEEAIEFNDCSKYIFDLDYFLTSKWFEEIQHLYLDELEKNVTVLKEKLTKERKKISEICNLN